jgi:hypothetical protein
MWLVKLQSDTEVSERHLPARSRREARWMLGWLTVLGAY